MTNSTSPGIQVGAPKMTKVERVLAAVRGEPVDRVPVSFWYHFGVQDQPPKVFADAEVAFYRKYDVDWLKVMHDFTFGGDELQGSIKSASHWRSIRPVGRRESGFAKQAEALKRIGDGLKGEAMYVDTIFGVWATAQKLCGRAGLEHLKADRAAFKDGLKVVAESLANYVPVALESGASGIYIAVDGAMPDVVPLDDYLEIIKPLDAMILDAAKAARFNVLHIHGQDVYFKEFLDLPNVSGVSWSFGISRPTIAEARAMYPGCIISGIDETKTIHQGSIAEIETEIEKAVRDAGGRGIIVASGCAVPTDTPEEKLLAARRAVDKLK